jgi:hypothetical protein
MRVRLPMAGLEFVRRLELHGRALAIRETVMNLADFDRPIAWTQHVTLGPPFLEPGVTQLRASAPISIGRWRRAVARGSPTCARSTAKPHPVPSPRT